MTEPKTPYQSAELLRRIGLIRRDIGNLLFHFTRTPEEDVITWDSPWGGQHTMRASASAVLRKILHEARLLGTGDWTGGRACICFTEAPIHECQAVFSLNELAAEKEERPRYEPYGVAVNKSWLFNQGGRPVIYDDPAAISELPDSEKYRFVPYDPATGIDYTWEREWRVPTECLALDPRETLVIVPSADEAFEIVYEFAEIEADWDVDGTSGHGYPVGAYHVPNWLAVSLDLFGLNRKDVV